VTDYLRGRWNGIGHNPLGALSVLALLAALFVQAALGLISQDEDGIYMGPLARLVSSDSSDRARDFHETWFNVILALVALHLAAIIFYRLRGRGLTKAMITGQAVIPAGTQPMRPGKWWLALICLVIAIAIVRWIIAGAPPFGS
jgi:cytochrome b